LFAPCQTRHDEDTRLQPNGPHDALALSGDPVTTRPSGSRRRLPRGLSESIWHRCSKLVQPQRMFKAILFAEGDVYFVKDVGRDAIFPEIALLRLFVCATL